MGKFKFIKTSISDLYIVEPRVAKEDIGYVMDTYNQKDFFESGLDMVFVHENEIKCRKGILRGLHFQTKFTQGKLIRVIKGQVYNVAVDLRKKSPTYGKWESVILSEKNKNQFYIPEGFAHGYLVLSKEAVFSCKCTNVYAAEYDGGLLWNDEDVAIDWPLDKVEEVILSQKDKKLPTLKMLELPF